MNHTWTDLAWWDVKSGVSGGGLLERGCGAVKRVLLYYPRMCVRCLKIRWNFPGMFVHMHLNECAISHSNSSHLFTVQLRSRMFILWTCLPWHPSLDHYYGNLSMHAYHFNATTWTIHGIPRNERERNCIHVAYENVGRHYSDIIPYFMWYIWSDYGNSNGCDAICSVYFGTETSWHF